MQMQCNASAVCWAHVSAPLRCHCLLACLPPGAFPDLIADFIGSVVHYYYHHPPRAA
jgi:hypothetical protein